MGARESELKKTPRKRGFFYANLLTSGENCDILYRVRREGDPKTKQKGTNVAQAHKKTFVCLLLWRAGARCTFFVVALLLWRRRSLPRSYIECKSLSSFNFSFGFLHFSILANNAFLDICLFLVIVILLQY